MTRNTRLISLLVLSLLISMPTLAASATAREAHSETMKTLGQALYFDVNLPLKRTQSCATCHNPEKGFVDDRDNGVGRMSSLGDDGHSLGDRSAPTAAYAAFSPAFHRNAKGKYVGGQFWDGRAATLQEQAEGPPLNPSEMALADKIMFVARLKENPWYVSTLQTLFGANILNSPEDAYRKALSSIVAFEQSALFAPFDSKYDRYLKGEYQMTEQEELGRTLFFSKQFTNCN